MIIICGVNIRKKEDLLALPGSLLFYLLYDVDAPGTAAEGKTEILNPR